MAAWVPDRRSLSPAPPPPRSPLPPVPPITTPAPPSRPLRRIPLRREEPRPRRRVPRVLLAIPAVLIFALGIFAVAVAGTGYAFKDLAGTQPPAPVAPSPGTPEKQMTQLRNEQKKLQTALTKKIPPGTYVVIDQTHNRVYLKKGEEITLEAVCSAGSGLVLRESAAGGRKWVFDTPRGAFKVIQRRENPVWKKPDWAFVEEGKPIPKRDSDRFEYGMLGEYALSFGDGYMMHGTLYERLLGRSVTHGCIRIGRDDLRVVWRECPLGTRIFIY
jgi:L,D-transpeptidase YbiS